MTAQSGAGLVTSIVIPRQEKFTATITSQYAARQVQNYAAVDAGPMTALPAQHGPAALQALIAPLHVLTRMVTAMAVAAAKALTATIMMPA